MEQIDSPKQRSLALLWNSSAGWSDSDRTKEAVTSVLQNGNSHVEIRQVNRNMDIEEESRALAATRPDVLVAAGGDGTVNAAASALLHQSTALGLIPAGTLNHFARDLRIPLDAESAARVMVEGRPIQVDAGSVNGRIFINNAVLGLFANYRSAREALDRTGLGRFRLGRGIATLLAAAKVFWRLPHLSVSLLVEGREVRLRTPFVLIGNNQHRMEGFALGSRNSLNEGKLWVYAMRPCTRWQLLRLVTRLILGKERRETLFELFAASELLITSRKRRLRIGIDGEMARMRSPLLFESLPGALRVIAPQPAVIAPHDED